MRNALQYEIVLYLGLMLGIYFSPLFLVAVASMAVFFYDVYACAFAVNRQRLGDVVAGTLVVRTEPV